jgi:hypothetical protein
MIYERQHGFRTRPLSYSAIERYAANARLALLPMQSPTDAISGVNLFEDLHQLEIENNGVVLQVNYAVNELPAGLEGITSYDSDRQEILITLSPSTYSSLEGSMPRAIFCLCHELGHVCVHTQKLVELSRIPHDVAALHRGEVPSHRIFEDTEWQANAFAAAFLMPGAGLAEIEARGIILTAQEIVRRYNVSFDAARIRLDIYRARRSELI